MHTNGWSPNNSGFAELSPLSVKCWGTDCKFFSSNDCFEGVYQPYWVKYDIVTKKFITEKKPILVKQLNDSLYVYD